MSDNLVVPMSLASSSRMCHLTASVLCLAVFLIGSNYCVISAWSGNVRMACLTAPATPTKAPKCSHCSTAGHSAKKDAQPSCCPAPVVTPSAPAIDKHQATAPVNLILGLVAAAQIDELSAAPCGRPAASESPPPTRLVHAPLPARAPPLA